MDSQLAELIRKYKTTPDLDNGLRSANELLRTGRKEEAFRFLDTVYMHHLETLPGVVAEVSQEYHADITETVEYRNNDEVTNQIVRREAQALEAIAERASIKPDVWNLTVHHVRVYFLTNSGLQEVPEELIQLPHLNILALNGNQLKTLQHLPNLPQLKQLYLGANPLKTLQDLPPLKKLAAIWIGNTQIPQQEIDELRERVSYVEN